MTDIQLLPPIGTCYFKSYTYDLTCQHEANNAHLTVKFYIYVTQAKPTEPKFSENGRIFIMVEYIGLSTTVRKLTDTFGIEFLESPLTLIDQHPVTGAEVTHGNVKDYIIDYQQSMNMFDKGGNHAFIFPAKYKRTFGLKEYVLNDAQPSGWVEWWNGKVDGNLGNIPLDGFQVFETNKLGVSKCKLYLSIGHRTETKEITLDYSSTTMASAVVG